MYSTNLVLNTPHHFAEAIPAKFQSVKFTDGSGGTNGTTLEVDYILDIDEGKKHIGYKVVGGSLLELYRNVFISTDVETKDGVDFITWTLEYELLVPENPHPVSIINFWIEFTKEFEAHHLAQQE
ncbi:hypothetical protein M569_09820 [Genlisea aurea]|uniref:Bet v I/Major latex protein domain-containing protein n=1 Tax=Genlisea aurea TaxID=192259 RepID=S8CDC7_9LAMI|nr:hypothetical protein M569_09820 [Genlisea aurea]